MHRSLCDNKCVSVLRRCLREQRTVQTQTANNKASEKSPLLTIFVGAAANNLGGRELAWDCTLVHFAATGQQHEQLACNETNTERDIGGKSFAGRRRLAAGVVII